MTFNDTIRRLSAAPPIEKPSQMPKLKNAFGMTVETVEHQFHARGLALVRERGISEPQPRAIDSLYLVPRAELLAGQVLVA